MSPRKSKSSQPSKIDQGDPADLLSNPYEVLGISRQATSDEIKKAYFVKVREFPPERDANAFKRIRAAYDALRTPEARAAADLFLLNPPLPHEFYKRAPVFDLDFQVEDWLRLAESFSELEKVDFRTDFRPIDL